MARRAQRAADRAAATSLPATVIANPDPVEVSVPDDVTLIPDPVTVIDGALHVRLAGHDLPLLMGGQPVPGFLPGWRAGWLFTGFAPLFLLELVHEDGGRATWFHDYRMQQMGDNVATLPSDLLDLLKLHALPLLRLLIDPLLHAGVPVLDPRARAFLGVNRATRLAIAHACVEGLVRPPALYLAEHLMPHALVYRGEDRVLHSIDRDHLAAGLVQDWQDRIPGYVRDGRMTWPSPVDGAPLEAQGSLVFDDFHFAYRFADRRHGLVFFVIVGEHLAAIAGVWFPSMGLMVSHDEAQRRLAWQLIRSMPAWFVTHVAIWAGALFTSLDRGATRFASVMRGPPSVHIGHQLWNELSGLDRFVTDETAVAAGGPRCEWIVLNGGDGIELYGPIDTLFPELAGRVNRRLHDHDDLARYAYNEGVFILRVTREFVSAGLRQRIQRHVAGLPAARRVAESVPVVRDAPVILFGLRVENRTVVDLGEFLTQFIAMIAGRHPGAVVVFDGHNAPSEADDGRVIGSHGERFAGRSPADVEHELVAALRTAFADLPVTIADTIGRPISASLAWASASDCFVSIWGASLAKYRWVCNTPGYVLTGRTNLLHRGDLHIYDDPKYMQDPSPLLFADPELVTDVPDAVQLVPVAPGAWALFNFQLDTPRILEDIDSFIRSAVETRRAG